MLLSDIKEQVFNKDKIKHAILLFGDENTCFETANYLAKALLCMSNGQKPCNTCNACNKIQKNIHPDVKIISSDKAKNSFHVQKVRDIKSDAYIMPNESKYKVYILKNAQTMTTQAQNAILKLLEEPPKNVIFILTCKNKQELLPTVISRCVCFGVGISDNLEKQKVKNNANELLEAIIKGYIDFFAKTSILLNEKEKITILSTSNYIINILEKALKCKGKTHDEFSDIEIKLAEKFSYFQLAKLEKIFISLNEKLEMNANKNIIITNLSIEVLNIINKRAL